LSVGNYEYYWVGNDSYGGGNTSGTSFFNISKATPNLSLSFSTELLVFNGTNVVVEGLGCPSQLTCDFYVNGSLNSTPFDYNLTLGTYTFVYNTSGNTNYFSSSASEVLQVVAKRYNATISFVTDWDWVKMFVEG